MRHCPRLAPLALAAAFSAADEPIHHYGPQRRDPPALEGILRHVAAGHDAFPEEQHAEELATRLAELGRLLREGRAAEVTGLLAPDFVGGALSPLQTQAVAEGPALAVERGTAFARTGSLHRDAFAAELVAFVGGLGPLATTEFLITSLSSDAQGIATEVRYDLVGSGPSGSRAERVGGWSLRWRREGEDPWRVTAWRSTADVYSRASRPLFRDVTGVALGRADSFRRQLGHGLDRWIARLDGALLPSGMGHHGVSVGDADGDGRDDFYVAQPAGLPNRLFRNLGDGAFEDATEAAGLLVLDSTSQSLFADVENDGDQDLVLVTRTGLLLFRNDGRGRFAPVPDAFRTRSPLKGSPTSVAMADYDRDGFLDLYLCTYAYFIGASEDKAGTPTPYHDARNGPPNVLFRNDGSGRFVDATAEARLDAGNDRFSFAAAFADYDDDGWPDLLVANDFGGKNLYRNQGRQGGQVSFVDVAEEAGVLDIGAGMSAAFLDYDGDGRLDVYTGNMWSAAGLRVTGLPGFKPEAPEEVRALYRRHARGNSLFRNRGDGRFEDVSLAARAEMGRWAWSSDALDFDNDGNQDLYVVNGMFTRAPGEDAPDLDSFFWRQVTARSPLTMVRGTAFDDAWRATNRLLAGRGAQAPHERNVMLRNDGRGGFDEVAGTLGLDLDQDGRSFAAFDYDEDGDADLLLLAARSEPQLRLFRNEAGGPNRSLAVRLRGTASNRDAVGARVTVETESLRRAREVQAGSGFISQHAKELLFGLGRSERVVRVEVRWPSGATDVVSGAAPGQRLLVEEGRGLVSAEPFRAEAADPGPPAAALADPPSGGSWLYRPFPAPDFTLRDLEGRERSLAGLKGRPALLLFWSASVAPSRAALIALSSKAASGLEVLALAVDPEEEEARVKEAARGLALPVLRAGGEVAGTYSVLSRYLFDRREELRLPTALLLDPEGGIVKVYRDRIDADEVAGDAGRLGEGPAARRERALPFKGTFYSPPAERSYFQYSLDLAEQGFEAAALAGFERAASLEPSAITFFNLGTLRMKAGRPRPAREAFEQALRLEPLNPEANNSLGALLAQSEDLKGAIARFEKALAARPEFPDALNNLGYALYQAGEEQRPFDLYQKALELKPEFPEAYNNLGIYFGQAGDLARAEGYFRRAVDQRAGYGEAANNLALVIAARGDAAGAVAVLEALLRENPGFESGYLTLCRVNVEAGRRREALQALERLLQRNPQQAQAQEMLQKLRTAGRN